MSRIIGKIELVDESEIEIDAGELKSKKAAVKYAKRIKKKGLWVTWSQVTFGEETFVFADEIKSISLVYKPIEIPRRPDRPQPKDPLLNRRPQSKDPILT